MSELAASMVHDVCTIMPVAWSLAVVSHISLCALWISFAFLDALTLAVCAFSLSIAGWGSRLVLQHGAMFDWQRNQVWHHADVCCSVHSASCFWLQVLDDMPCMRVRAQLESIRHTVRCMRCVWRVKNSWGPGWGEKCVLRRVYLPRLCVNCISSTASVAHCGCSGHAHSLLYTNTCMEAATRNKQRRFKLTCCKYIASSFAVIVSSSTGDSTYSTGHAPS